MPSPARQAAHRRHRLRITKASTGPELRARRALNDALRTMEPRLAVAFGRAVQSILDKPGIMRALTEAIENGDVTGAEEAIRAGGLADALRGEGIDPKHPSFQAELTAAFQAGGQAGQLQMGRSLAMAMGSLDITNPGALAYLRDTVPVMIREISEESRAAVREAMMRGFNEGRPAALIAREVRDSVGLTRTQAVAVSNFRRTLESGQMVGARISTRRLSGPDKAIASMLYSQAAAGTPPSRRQVDEITDRYHQSLVNRRARNIARTEATRAFGEGQQALWDQAVARGLLDPAKTRRKWLVTPDERLREEHAAVPRMNEHGVRLDEPFATPIGPVMGPRQSGVAGFDINCRCTVILEIDDD